MYASEIKDSAKIRVKAGVGLIITDHNGRILLEKRSDNGRWGLAGGGIEAGETIIETARREAKEETGLDIEITGFLGVYSDPSAGRIVTYPDNGDEVQLVDVLFTAKVLSGQLQLSDESLELRFFRPNDLPEGIVPPAVKPLEDYLEGKMGNIC